MLTVSRKVSPLARVSVRKTTTSHIYKDLFVNCPQVSPFLLSLYRFGMFSPPRSLGGHFNSEGGINDQANHPEAARDQRAAEPGPIVLCRPLTNPLGCPLRKNTTMSKLKDAEDPVYECERLKQNQQTRRLQAEAGVCSRPF